MKKTLALILAVVMIFGMLPTVAFAADWTAAPKFAMTATRDGNTVSVSVAPTTDVNLTSVDFKLAFDKANLTVVGDEGEGTGVYDQLFVQVGKKTTYADVSVANGVVSYAVAVNANVARAANDPIFSAEFTVASTYEGAVKFEITEMHAGTEGNLEHAYAGTELPSAKLLLTTAITGVQDLSKTYDGNAVSEPTYTYGGDGEVTVKWYKSDDTELQAAPSAAGSYKVGVSAAEGENYNAVAEVKKSFTISKATMGTLTAPGKTVVATGITGCDGKQYTYDLTTVTGAPDGTEFVVKSKSSFLSAASVSGTTLSFTVGTAQAADAKGSIVLTAKNTNYNDKDVTLTLTFKGKVDVSSSIVMTAGSTIDYNGQDHAADITATYNSNPLTVVITKGGSVVTEAKNAGTYTFTATYEDNVADGDLPGHIGTKSVTLTINKIHTLITNIQDLSKTYDGNAVSEPTYTYTGDGQVNIVWKTADYDLLSSAPTNAGTYKVGIAAAAGTNYNAVAETLRTFTISKADTSVTDVEDLSKTYDGTAVSEPTYTYTGDGQVTVTWYDAQNTVLASAPKDAGDYKVGVKAAAGTNYNAAAEAKQSFTISQANMTGVTAADMTLLSSEVVSTSKQYTYDLSAKITGAPAGTTYVVKTPGTYVGTPTISGNTMTFTVTTAQTSGTEDSVEITAKNDNYIDEDITVSFEFKSKTNVDSDITFEGDTVTYDGQDHKTAIAPLYKGEASDNFTVVITKGGDVVTSAVDAGTYTFTANYEDDVLENDVPGHVGTKSATLVIEKATASVTGIEDLSKTYDGEAVSEPDYTYDGDGQVTVEYFVYGEQTAIEAPANAGSYTVKISATEGDNYNATSATANFTVQRAAASVTDIEDLSKTYDEVAVSAPDYTYDGDGEVSFLWYNAKNDLLFGAPMNAGKYKVVVSAAAGTNYKAASASKEFTIAKAESAVEFISDPSKNYDGTAIDYPGFMVTGDGELTTKWYDSNGKALKSAPTEAGSYTFGVSVAEGENYKACSEVKLGVFIYNTNISVFELQLALPHIDISDLDNELQTNNYAQQLLKAINEFTVENPLTVKSATRNAVFASEEMEAWMDKTGVLITVRPVIEAKSVSSDSMTLDIKFVAEVDALGEDTEEIELTELDQKVQITMPTHFRPSYVKHTHNETLSYIPGVWDDYAHTFTFEVDCFSEFELVKDDRFINATFLTPGGDFYFGTEYTAEDAAANVAFPTYVQTGYRFNGYVNEVYTTPIQNLTMDIFNDICENANSQLLVKASVTGYGGGGGGTATYAVTTVQPANGTLTVSAKSAYDGATVSVNVTANTGYVVEGITVTDANGNKVAVKSTNGAYSFTMPASAVTVTATVVDGEQIFRDVANTAYYAPAVRWAVEKKITAGTSATTFTPDASCTRGQMVTFLWRTAGSPDSDTQLDFVDVKAGAYYETAVAWALDNGITNGKGKGIFDPEATVTRAEAITFLYRFAKATATAGNTFTDVAANVYYAPAVAWAVANGITNGTTATTFGPDDACIRAQIVTFLYRLLNK